MRLGRVAARFVGSLLALVSSVGVAEADLMAGICESDGGGVAADIVALADDTRASRIFLERDAVVPALGIRLASELDAAPGTPGMPRSGAATELIQGEFEEALASMDAYAIGVKKTPVVEGAQDHALGLIEDALFLSGCILALR
jgi:hypothetical protein